MTIAQSFPSRVVGKFKIAVIAQFQGIEGVLKNMLRCRAILTVHVCLLLLASPNETAAQAKKSKKEKIIELNSGLCDDVELMLESSRPELEIYDIRNGDTIADIGFGWAWLEGILMLAYDSLTIYANDVNKKALKNIGPITDAFSELRSSPQNNKLIVVAGSDTETGLPSHTFRKVLVRETFHHFAQPEAMLLDLKRILHTEGRIIIVEPDVPETIISKQCNAPNYSRERLRAYFHEAGFRVIEEHDLSHLPYYSVPWQTYESEYATPLRVYVLGHSVP